MDLMYLFFFFKQKTAYEMRISDWSSDVCSSDLEPKDNWTALFRPGERVRLRFINAAAMTSFNVRIPGLSLGVVQADGQNVRPVEVGEFQIAVAETYDVIVQPVEERAFTLVAEEVDRSGMALAQLEPCRSEARRVGKECVSTGRSRG